MPNATGMVILLMEEAQTTTWHVWNLTNNGICTISTGAGFVPLTVVCFFRLQIRAFPNWVVSHLQRFSSVKGWPLPSLRGKFLPHFMVSNWSNPYMWHFQDEVILWTLEANSNRPFGSCWISLVIPSVHPGTFNGWKHPRSGRFASDDVPFSNQYFFWLNQTMLILQGWGKFLQKNPVPNLKGLEQSSAAKNTIRFPMFPPRWEIRLWPFGWWMQRCTQTWASWFG